MSAKKCEFADTAMERVTAMLNWPWWRYKLTLGVGALATTGMMADLWQKVVPVWAIMAVTLLPILIFLFVKAGELPAWFVRAAQR